MKRLVLGSLTLASAVAFATTTSATSSALNDIRRLAHSSAHETMATLTNHEDQNATQKNNAAAQQNSAATEQKTQAAPSTDAAPEGTKPAQQDSKTAPTEQDSKAAPADASPAKQDTNTKPQNNAAQATSTYSTNNELPQQVTQAATNDTTTAAQPGTTTTAASEQTTNNIGAQMSTDSNQTAESYLENNAKQADITTLADGLQYKILETGTGATPSKTSTVTVHYSGTLTDGTEFDSSFKRGQPATFRLDQVIKGWTEALTHMKAGSTWMLYIPPSLAYGSQGIPGVIPPNSVLVFKVQLISVDK